MKTKMLLLAALVGAAVMSANAGVRFGFFIGLPLPVVASTPVVCATPVAPVPVTVVQTVPPCPSVDYVWVPGLLVVLHDQTCLGARRMVLPSGSCRIWPLLRHSPLVVIIGRPLQNGRSGFRHPAMRDGQFRFLSNCGGLPTRRYNGREFFRGLKHLPKSAN